MHRRPFALVTALVLFGSLSGCARALYTFPEGPTGVPRGQTNLLTDPSFEDSSAKICVASSGCPLGWSLEHTPSDPPTFSTTGRGAVTGSRAFSLDYRGQSEDDGVHRFVELYQGVANSATTAGHLLTFTIWVSGSCLACTPFTGIEAFDSGGHYLGESDQYFDPPESPRPVRITYRLPAGATAVAAYLQVPEIYSVSVVDLTLDDASLMASN